MPGYPCCCNDPVCSYCSDGTPDSLTIEVPAGIDDVCAGDCTALAGSYSLPRRSACFWQDEFAVTDPQIGTFCTRQADKMDIRVNFLSAPTSVLVQVKVWDSTDVFGRQVTWEFEQELLVDPVDCCAWSAYLVPWIRVTALGSGPACDFSGTSAGITASAGGC